MVSSSSSVIGTLLPLICGFLLIVQSHGIETGKPHDSVQILTNDNVEAALNDPANGLWMLKFYAPWCGHCKKLAPTLNSMAPYLSGKLAIGKIDCTDSSAKPICDRHEIKGYPTLKIYRDGDYFDYPGKRDADSMIEFAERMSRPAVTVVAGLEDALKEIVTGGGGKKRKVGVGDGVGFVAYDPNAPSIGVGEGGTQNLAAFLSSSKGLQVFGQVARKLQHEARFAVLPPSLTPLQLAAFGIVERPEGPVLMRIEEGVDASVYTGPNESPEFLGFVRDNNVALVTELAGNNFRAMGKMGRPLAIAVVDGKDRDKTEPYIENVRDYAKNGALRKGYVFCRMDGKTWKGFLEQFPIDSDKLPTFLLLDSPKKQYWYDEMFSNSVGGFLEAVEEGKIEVQKLVQKRKDSFWENLGDWVEDNLGVVLILLVCGVLFTIFLLYMTSGKNEWDEEMEACKKTN